MGSPILVIDNYDSFVFNIVQYLQELSANVEVVRNDHVDAAAIENGNYSGVLISPGPGHPSDAGQVSLAIQSCVSKSVPLLGVCLGHQAIGLYFGGHIGSAPELFHGRSSALTHDGGGIFRGLPDGIEVGRYHSLVVEPNPLPSALEVSARSGDVIMGLRHKELPIESVQFHPESVMTQYGHLLLGNWLVECGFTSARQRAELLSENMMSVTRRVSML